MIGNAYVMVVLGIVLAKGFGFYRDMIFAGVFGAGVASDIYFQVFGLVNLIFTGVGVALSTLVIKNINKAENFGKEKAYAARFLQKSVLYLCIAAIVMALAAPAVIKVILPELGDKNFATALQLFYIMIPAAVFVVVAYIVSGILQNEKVYFITAIMSLPYNAIIVLSLMMPKPSVITVGIATTIGWFLHIIILLPSFYKKGYSLVRRKGAEAHKDKNPEILWIFISNMMFQLCFYTDRAAVSGSEGMASTFNYASNLFITVSSVFVVAMSTVVFPSVSKNYEEGNVDYVNDLLKYIITIMVAIFLPFLLVVYFFGSDVIKLIYERGEFTAQSTASVAVVFFIYSLGILGYVCQELFNKILYLANKYIYTVIGTIVVIVGTFAADCLIGSFVPSISFGGGYLTLKSILVAATTSLLLTGYAVASAIWLKKVVGAYWKRDLVLDIVKIFGGGVLAAAVYVIFNVFAPGFTHGYITFIVPLCVCGVVYAAVLYKTGVLMKLIKREKAGEN